MLEQTPVYIGAEDMMRLKAQIYLNDLFDMFAVHNAANPIEEKERLRAAFIACMEGIDLNAH